MARCREFNVGPPFPTLRPEILGVVVPRRVLPVFARRRDGAVGEEKGHWVESGRRDDDTVIREHLANERTLLSWVRTGVGPISIGLVVERAGALVDAAPGKVASTSASELFGLALALLGVLTLVMGAVQFMHTRRRISVGEFVPSAAAYLVIVAGSLTFASVFIVYVLFA